MSGVILEIDGVTKRYKDKYALRDACLTVGEGEITALIGENGAGKTTLLKIITGMLRADAGSATMSQSDSGRRNIGALIESPGFYPDLCGEDNLIYFSKILGCDEANVKGILDMIGLANAGKKKYRNYSLGMKQRLGIGAALLGNPRLLVLDEPINGLDPTGIMDVRNIIRSAAESNTAVLISSHILSELENLADVYVFIHHGRIVKRITQEERDRLGISLEDCYKEVIREG